jgi:hypothetical protein
MAQAVIAVTVVINCVLSWRNGKKSEKIVEEVSVIKEATNGLTGKLLEVTSSAKFAEGVKHGEDYARRSETAKEA